MHYLPLPAGGAAGAVSRITGTLGKGLATLTLDDDYQKKRREQMNKRPATAREGFARGGKGLVMVSWKHPRLIPLLFRHHGQGFCTGPRKRRKILEFKMKKVGGLERAWDCLFLTFVEKSRNFNTKVWKNLCEKYLPETCEKFKLWLNTCKRNLSEMCVQKYSASKIRENLCVKCVWKKPVWNVYVCVTAWRSLEVWWTAPEKWF